MSKRGGPTVSGLKELKAGLLKRNKFHVEALRIGLFKAGLFLQRESQKIVPVETSNLKGSATTRAVGQGKKVEVLVGYGAAYAVFVHEDLEARHKPGKTAKFLERPLREKRSLIAAVAVAGAKGYLL